MGFSKYIYIHHCKTLDPIDSVIELSFGLTKYCMHNVMGQAGGRE